MIITDSGRKIDSKKEIPIRLDGDFGGEGGICFHFCPTDKNGGFAPSSRRETLSAGRCHLNLQIPEK